MHMKIAVGLLFALALHLAFVSPADAAEDFDSAYAGESAFLHVGPTDPYSFQVFFINTGRVTWVKGTATQVDLAVCLEDKITCNVSDPREAGWNAGWLSPIRYATQTQATVAPNAMAAFSYQVKAPSDPFPSQIGVHHFNGDLVVALTGRRIHPEGYYQDAELEGVRAP
jgi:hypothetical protein